MFVHPKHYIFLMYYKHMLVFQHFFLFYQNILTLNQFFFSAFRTKLLNSNF